ncbi:hypothetical protein E2562_006070 [Oryza meyeriana var. granulata]|uniref:Uncharacterized protein n=1 Tax=Oryza meyeriana var. granulata TaxID=110450 RepID=A0A6G1EVH4_9ORYZ|nr:hypothetical protein E2562_006070 [Oryza meyeriana var. granulata]
MEKAKVPKAHWDAFASKINKEYGKFRYSPIDNLNELEVMFQNIHVSGASSVIPGASKDNAKDKAAIPRQKAETTSTAIRRHYKLNIVH